MLNMESDTLYRRIKSSAIGLLAIASLLVTSCKKAEDRTCFKSTGKETELAIPLPDFDKLFLREHIEFVMIQDSTDQLVIKGGENLVKHITWNIDQDKVLEIKNKNKCSFLRKLNKRVMVEIHFTNMSNIHFEGTEPLTNRDTLFMPYFTLLIRDGAGPVKLNFNSIGISADISHGWGDYTLAGKTQYARIAARSNGFCDVLNLKVRDSLTVSSETSGLIKVNANGIPLRGNIKTNGDIWYYGVPTLIDVNRTGSGKLISKE